MRKFVYGRDVIILAKKGPDYYPFACATSVKLRMTTPLLETATADTGVWDTYEYTEKGGWDAEISGVLVLEDEIDTLWFGWELFLRQVRSDKLDLKFLMRDNEGNEKFATGQVLIPESEIIADVEDFAEWLAKFQGSGALDLSGVLTEGDPDMGIIRIPWIGSGPTIKKVQDNKLIGLTTEEVYVVGKEGDTIYTADVISVGAPTDRQVKLDNVEGTLEFKNDIEDTDYVYAVVKKK